jgi:hypothetical protein
MVTVSVITIMDNGLEATAITEFAGQCWSGRALGVQNTTQRLMALAGPPAFGALITAGGYPLAFALCGLFPLAAVPIVPIGLLAPGLEDRAEGESVRAPAQGCSFPRVTVATPNRASFPASSQRMRVRA